MHGLTIGQAVMLVAGLLLAAAGAGLLIRLRPFTRDTPAAYAARIAGTMLAMLGLLLIFFAVAVATHI